MGSSGDFKTMVGAICSMPIHEREELVRLLDCEETSTKWSAQGLLEFIAYKGSNLSIASLALKALKEVE
jgi:hypothetical protein